VAFRAPVNTPHRFTRRNIIRFVWRNTPFQGICFEFFAATFSRQFAPLLVKDPDHVSSVVRDQSQAEHWDAQYPSLQPSQIKCGARLRGPFLGSASNGLDPFPVCHPAVGVVLWSSSNVVSIWSIFSTVSKSKFLRTPSRTWASYPITKYQRSFGEIPPPPDLLLLPDPFPRRSASSIASTSLVTTRVLISGATPFCVTLRRFNPGLGIGNGANSSSRTLPMSWRRSGRPLVLVKTN